jgi:hypothetical protein
MQWTALKGTCLLLVHRQADSNLACKQSARFLLRSGALPRSRGARGRVQPICRGELDTSPLEKSGGDLVVLFRVELRFHHSTTFKRSGCIIPVAEAVVDVPRKRGSQWSQLITPRSRHIGSDKQSISALAIMRRSKRPGRAFLRRYVSFECV